MSVVPGSIDTDAQPPMTVPLRHFLVGLGFLVAGVLLGAGLLVGGRPAGASLAHVHLLLVGFVCVTIMGAMTQFVPVWSGVALHSRRLANAQLALVAAGLAGFATALLVDAPGVLPAVGLLMTAGFWTFAYNVGRTLGDARPLDVTERHFALALGFLLAATALGPLLALDLTTGVLAGGGPTHDQVRAAHATLAVFGAVLTTVLGALYQLATMFTQTELHGVDRPLRRLEELAYPGGVAALATGRLLGDEALGVVGGLGVLAGLAAVAVVLARKLAATQVAWTPMHRRYAVVPVAVGLWVAVTLPAWLRAPLAVGTTFGGDGGAHLLLLGVVGFVLVGTLYHVVPFLVWVHRYSDRLGLEPVPMIDDLYDGRVAAAELALLLAGTAAVVLGDAGGVAVATAVGAWLLLPAVALFVTNLVLVVHRHGGHRLGSLLLGRTSGSGDGEEPGPDGAPPGE